MRIKCASAKRSACLSLLLTGREITLQFYFFLFSLVSLKQIIENISAKSGFIFKKLSGNLPVGIQKWVKQIKEYKKNNFICKIKSNHCETFWKSLCGHPKTIQTKINNNKKICIVIISAKEIPIFMKLSGTLPVGIQIWFKKKQKKQKEKERN